MSLHDTVAILTLNSYYMSRRSVSFLTVPCEITNVSSDLSLSRILSYRYHRYRLLFQEIHDEKRDVAARLTHSQSIFCIYGNEMCYY
jgi:hypothetical protein